MSPGFQHYESTGVSPTLWPNSGRQKGIPTTPLLHQSAPEKLWAACVVLLQLEGLSLAILILPRCYFLLEYLQFLCPSPWPTFLQGGAVHSDSYFHFIVGNIKEILMSLDFFLPDPPLS